MKYLASILITLILFVLVSTDVSANPTNEHKASYYLHGISGNKNVVSYHADGHHEIPGEEGQYHWGTDLVMKAGESGNFHQWFLGWSREEGYHGEHSLWLLKRQDECPDDFILYENPFPDWGYHFPEGEDYCVKTNDYKLGSWWEHQELPWSELL